MAKKWDNNGRHKTGMFGLWSKHARKFTMGIQAPSPSAVFALAEKELGKINKASYIAKPIEQRHAHMFRGKLRYIDNNTNNHISASLDWLSANLHEQEKVQRNIEAAKNTIIGSVIPWKGETATIVAISTDNRKLKLQTPTEVVNVTFYDVHLETGRD